MYVMQSDRLRVDVSAPGEAPNVTTRFDRSGFIEEVVLDGLHRFCASEPRNLSHKSSGGRGICNEYICGCDAGAKIGEYFPKPGVGLLLKETDGPYRFMNHYEVCPFEVDVSHEGNAMRFVTKPKECLGYALRQEKRLEVVGNRLEMRVKLENVGDKVFEAEEYCHNFISVNNMSLGPNYRLEFPSGADRGDKQIDGELVADGRALTFTGPLAKSRQFIIPGADFDKKQGEPFEWEFKNTAEGVKVKLIEHINLSRVVIWCADHMMSTESFHKVVLKPGECDSWTRSWFFDIIE